MAFDCPGCGGLVPASPEAWLLRCSRCGGRIRSRPLEGSGHVLAYEVELAGRPETRTRLELPWDERLRRRLRAWLVASSAITLGLVVLLFALARWLR